MENVNSERDKIKISTTDHMFVEFVEKIEKFQKDLNTMEKFDEIANTQTISKLEVKLL